MKNLVSVLIFCLVIFSGCLTAQSLKFGHIDFQQLIIAMPEREVATTSFEKVRADLESELQAMQKEYSEKDKEYTALIQAKDPIEAIIKAKLDEIQSLQVRITTFQQTAQESLQKAESKLMQPLIETAYKAINDAAKELGLIFVFEVNSPRASVLYHSEQSIDLTLPVKAKLGITK
jgi:outer membrane protein